MIDAASGTAGKASARERNERFNKRRGGLGVEKRRKRAIQQAARRDRRPREKETRDSVSGAVCKALSRETNE
jgi:hypothetical protein